MGLSSSLSSEQGTLVPAVSVILPTFNRTRLLRLTIESVLAQTVADWEMIIADDGSGEDTQSYLRGIADPRVRTIWLAHSGNPSRVRNAAMQRARGRYLAFLDSDDLWTPDKLEKQLRALGEHPDRSWSYTNEQRIGADGRPLAGAEAGPGGRVFPEGWILEPLLKGEVVIAMPTLVVERGLAEQVGGFDERQLFGEYHELCLRLAMRSQVVALPEPLCLVRTHDENYSRDRIGEYLGWVDLFGKMADLSPSAAIRAHCRKKRAEASVMLARLRSDQGDHRGLWQTLARASKFSWSVPGWWLGASKAVLRQVLPEMFLSEYRRRRRPPTDLAPR